MAVNPSAFGPKPQYVDLAGNPAVGYQLFFYVAGSTSTKQDTFTDSTGGVANTNPIVLNALGEPSTQIWWTAGQSYKVVLAPPTDTDPPTSPVWTIDNLYGINDFTNSPAQSEWVLSPLTPTFVNATTFTVPGNQTADFQIGRRIKSVNTAGTSYGSITNSVFTTLTTVTLANTSGVLDSGLSQVSYGLLSATNPSYPSILTGVTSIAGLTSVNGGQLAGLRNRIINGGMTVDQRLVGTAKTYTAAAALSYAVDHWYGYCTGANVTGQQVAGSSQTQRRYQFTGAASVTAIGFGQRIEATNCYDLNGQTCTLGVDLANSLLTSVTWTAYYANTANTFGTLAAPTKTQIATGTFTVTSTVTRYSAQISVPAAATTGIEIVFTVGAQLSGTWTIGNVQLEIGSAASIFEQRPFPMELGFCQRYYEKSFSYSVVPAQNIGIVGAMLNFARVSGATVLAAYMPVYYKVPKFRAATTIVTFNPSAANAEVRDSVAAGDCSATTSTSAGENGFLITATGNAATVQAGSIMQVQWTSEGEIL